VKGGVKEFLPQLGRSTVVNGTSDGVLELGCEAADRGSHDAWGRSVIKDVITLF
jgi:hypothetical protein